MNLAEFLFIFFIFLLKFYLIILFGIYGGNIMLYRISLAERGITGIANIFRSRLNGLDDLLRAGTVPLIAVGKFGRNTINYMPF